VSGHPFTIAGIAPPGFFGETLRSNPPELWLPLQQEPLVNAQNSLLKQSISGWLRVIGRLKPGANIDGIAPRLTGILRQWMVHDSGWPGEFMPVIVKSLPKQQIQINPGGTGVATMKADYGDSLHILLTVCCLVLLIACANIANLLLARGAAKAADSAIVHGERCALCTWRCSRHCGCVSRSQADRRAHLSWRAFCTPRCQAIVYPCWRSRLACRY
jgi:hypothetical protein